MAFVAAADRPPPGRARRSPLVAAALVGALIVLVADLVARRLFAPTELPVGVVTGIVGAPYLLWLLARANNARPDGAMTVAPTPTARPLAGRGTSRWPTTTAMSSTDLSLDDPAGQDHRASSAPTPAASRRCCGRWPGCSARRRARSCSTARRSTACPPARSPRALGILPQSPVAPEGITVADLVGRGRYPHQGWFRQWTTADRDAVDRARCAATGTLDLADRPVDELSGGQRQRVWIAMALAQGTDLMLLDEPTTYLDLAHQVEVLDLLVDLNQREGRTIVLVLHDLNQACRYAHHLIAMRDGRDRRRGAAGARSSRRTS